MSTERQIWETRAAEAWTTRRSARWYRRTFDIADGELVVDLGTGKSRYAPDKFIRTDYKYSGKPYPKRGVNVACLFQQLPFADSRVDRVIAGNSMSHVYEGKAVAVAEALRILKVEGLFQSVTTFRTAISEDFLNQYSEIVHLDKRTEDPPLFTGAIALGSTIVGAASTAVAIKTGNPELAAGSGLVGGVGFGVGVGWLMAQTPINRLTVEKTPDMCDPAFRESFAADICAAFQL